MCDLYCVADEQTGWFLSLHKSQVVRQPTWRFLSESTFLLETYLTADVSSDAGVEPIIRIIVTTVGGEV